MIWTREQLYTTLEETPRKVLTELKKQVDACPWRQKFHIQPSTGLLNDPNGFAFYQGEYHLFYQWFPLGPVHGLKYWYHLKSKDLVTWKNLGIAIRPDYDYDNYGVYSGSGIEHQGDLYLMYTGNHRDKHWVRHPMQCIAIMHPNGEVEKLSHPVIKDVPEGYTEHFRDPKVWRQGENFYAVIGAQRQNQSGTAVIYKSPDLLNWSFCKELSTELKDFGYMWECPDYFELDGKGIFIFSPQGLEATSMKYQNIYQSGYLIGNLLNIETFEFSHGEFHELDHGFDFYAPQTMEDDKGRRILIGWMGLPDILYPTDKNGWAHCLTLPRELKIINGHLYQIPVEELKTLRKSKQNLSTTLKSLTSFGHGTNYELECEFTDIETQEVGLNLRVGEGEKTVIKYSRKEEKIILDRTLSGEAIATEYGTTRAITYNKDTLKLQIFMDTSSIEIFINNGEHVMTSRIFPTNTKNKIELFTASGTCQININKWDL